MFTAHINTFYDPFCLEKLKAKHLDQVVQLITRTFCDSEPMGQYLKLDYKGFAPFAEQVTIKAIQDELSIVALEEDQVVACALVEDIAKPLHMGVDLDQKFEAIFSLLDNLGNDFFSDKVFAPNHIAQLFITAVDSDYRGKGLSKKVNFAAMQLAYDNDFQFMFSKITNYLNEKGTIKHLHHRKKLIGSIPYHSYQLKQEKPFKHLPGTANAYIWELAQNARLRYKQNGKVHTLELGK